MLRMKAHKVYLGQEFIIGISKKKEQQICVENMASLRKLPISLFIGFNYEVWIH
jgi:hypothetical protein